MLILRVPWRPSGASSIGWSLPSGGCCRRR